jgi:hypothetical protein
MGRAGTFVVMAEVPAFLYPLSPPKGENSTGYTRFIIPSNKIIIITF